MVRPNRPPPYAGRVNVSTLDFRTVMGQFATGVTVVTTLDGDRPQGITVNALSSVSLDPPLVMIALDRKRFIVPAIEAGGRYAINILHEDQQWLSDCFAGAAVTPNRDAFCGATWQPGTTGLPLIAEAVATMECRVVERFEVGDHLLFVGHVEACSLDGPEAPPLLYHRRRYLRIERATTTLVAGKPESPAG
jgi:flavin reductase (DIM6/NTAB) family NADH-FMN oxidoreductase RutF